MKSAIYLIALAMLPMAAAAHPGHLDSGWQAGFTHPLAGIDHLLAMVAVGLWAGVVGGRARWMLPLLFLLMLAAGAGAAMVMGLTPPAVIEPGIAASVLALGLLLALRLALPVVMQVALVALFAVLHGLAHGAELPLGMNAGAYAVGFLCASALLQGSGLAVARWWPVAHERFVRICGAALAIAGTVLLATVS